MGLTDPSWMRVAVRFLFYYSPVFVYLPCECKCPRGPEEGVDTLELELQVIVSSPLW